MNDESLVAEEIKAAKTLPQLIRAAAAVYGEKPAVTLADEGIEVGRIPWVPLADN